MADRRNRLRGLYAITDPKLSPGTRLLEDVKAALEGGAKIIQYRDKESSDLDKLANAKYLQSLCQAHDALFIINDDIELAHLIGADGIHIGKDDGHIQVARQRLGEQAIIGVSCYNDLQRAQEMEQLGADYVAFGRFFPSQTKPNAPSAEFETLRKAKQQLSLPIVAIGGITPENGKTLIDQGADMLAVIHALFSHPTPAQIQATALQFGTLWKNHLNSKETL
jgi:thiamine-phosphate pyrophosphorylase